MEQTAQIKECAHTVAGIVAHVDAGKTTLAESMLYLTGGTRKLRMSLRKTEELRFFPSRQS